jgi:sec-independent protein translocase protein TatA
MQDDDQTAEKPEPVKSIDHSAGASAPTRSDVGSKAV